MNTEQNYVGRGINAISNPQAAQNAANSATLQHERRTLQVPTLLQTPFRAALLFTAEKQQSKSGFDAFVCYLNGKRVVNVERLHALRGHNPAVNLTPVINKVLSTSGINRVIVATWHPVTSEDPYAEEFIDEVYRQRNLLKGVGIKLVDNLRISETGFYSYYGQQEGPYSNAPVGHEQSICRLY